MRSVTVLALRSWPRMGELKSRAMAAVEKKAESRGCDAGLLGLYSKTLGFLTDGE